jgi:peptidoglycan/LPS O-acetylase OafA/YrhL
VHRKRRANPKSKAGVETQFGGLIQMNQSISTSTASGRHLAYLDGLRGLAALQVVLGHAAMQIHWDSTSQSGIVRAVTWPMSFAREAVAVFIVLSGFCLMLPVVRRDVVLPGGAWQFFKRRARRILPPYYFALGLSLLLIWTLIGQKTHTHWDVSLPADGKAIWSHLLLVQDLFHDTCARINHVMWSISVEWRIYFLFPLFVILWRKIGAAVATLLIVISSYLLVRWLHFDWLNTGAFGMCPQFIGLFALGMFGAGVAYSEVPQLARLRQTLPWGILAVVLFVIMVLTRELKLRQGAGLPWYLRDYIIGMFSMSLMIFAATKPRSMMPRFLSWKPIAFLGTFGYSLYLMHAPFLQVLTQYFISPLRLPLVPSFLLLVGVGTPVIVGLCYCFYWLCERPFLNAPVSTSVQTKATPAAAGAIVGLEIAGKRDA